jgi:LuxR family transcriptional regulator, maltose regulon positive regulatory protein
VTQSSKYKDKSPKKDDPLSEREEEVLHELAYGKSSKQIARQLSISEGTVKVHLCNIYIKLGVDSRIKAALIYHHIPFEN